jgi:hypothetical protein
MSSKHYVNDNNNFSVTSVTVSLKNREFLIQRPGPSTRPIGRGSALLSGWALRGALSGGASSPRLFISVPQFSLPRKHHEGTDW